MASFPRVFSPLRAKRFTFRLAGEDWESYLGFANTAACVGNLLGKPCPANRVSVKLNAGDVLYVAQVVGGRLPEGATELPEGFGLTFVRVDVLS